MDSLLALLKLRIKCSDYSTLSRRRGNLEIVLPRQESREPLHLAVDARRGEILAEITTENNVGDNELLADLRTQIDGDIETVRGDGAYDDRKLSAGYL